VSSRVRVYALVGAAAAAAAAAAALVAWSGRGDDGTVAAETSPPRSGAPPLALDVLVDSPEEAAALQEAVQLYEDGRREAALAAFEQVLADDPASLYAQVGAAFASWPDGTLGALDALAAEHPASALVELHRGLALFWEGKDGEAEAAWRRAEAIDPDSPAALRAESLVHPEMPAGRPFFVAGEAVPQDVAGLSPLEQLAELERRAEAGNAEDWILYGAALQRAGRSVSARAAFDRAVSLAPQDLEAQTAAAVARFDKDDPAQAFSRLGPLSARYAAEPVVQFHLGLLLLWLSQVEEATRHLEAARDGGAGTVWAEEARRLLDRLEEAQAGAATTS
jgi:tetratricopeptide (TPR) repeat protein